jgi:hypothetical protein
MPKRRRFYWICDRPTYGSRWYRRNFTFGLQIDNHPRFFNFAVCLIFVEVGFGWDR